MPGVERAWLLIVYNSIHLCTALLHMRNAGTVKAGMNGYPAGTPFDEIFESNGHQTDDCKSATWVKEGTSFPVCAVLDIAFHVTVP